MTSPIGGGWLPWVTLSATGINVMSSVYKFYGYGQYEIDATVSVSVDPGIVQTTLMCEITNG